VTGTAISPLLGVGAVGAYEWWKAPKEKRPRLPWFAQPWFWAPALSLVALVGLKDIFGTAAPTALKKPLDAIEAIENKLSALLAAGAFVPLILAVFPEANGDQSQLTPATLGFATASFGSLGNLALLPLAWAAFAVVWMASHAVNMLILISPFSTVDAALKAGRLFVLALLAALSMVSPWIGALFSIGLIVVSYFIAGWSFRLMIFGTVYLWDLLTVRRRRFQPGAESNWMFTARQIGEAPVRTYGRLVHEPGKPLCFEFRPLLVMKRRNSVLPDGAWFVGRGLFYPELDRITGDTYTTMFILPPRYMTHEFAVARAYGCSTVRDVGVLKGLKAVWAWIRGFRGATRLDAKAPEDLVPVEG